MGIPTSWASFALCHHLLVRIAGKRARVRTKGRFLILGDDLVIRGKKLADSYKSLLGELEISFSEADSFTSTRGKSIAEFAKRIFVNGQELSPLPLRLLEGQPLVSNEAAFLVRCSEIRHQFDFESVTYPGTSNRLETLFLCVYMFRSIRNKLQERLTCTDTDFAVHPSVINPQLAEILFEYFRTQIGSARELLIGYKPQGEVTVQYFLRILFGRNNQRVVSVNDGLLQMVCHHSSWAQALKDDDTRFIASVMQASTGNSLDDSIVYALTDFGSLLNAFKDRPRQPRLRDYHLERRRKDTVEFGILLSAFKIEGFFPLPREALDLFKASLTMTK
jgi:hypothetical protein